MLVDVPNAGQTRLAEGCYQCQEDDFDFDFTIWGGNAPEREMAYPRFTDGDPFAFGVCDTPEQFLNKYGAVLRADPRRLVVSFSHVEKSSNPNGWRWHKWGPYVGDYEPAREYLADEDGFYDGVFCYHIYCLDNPKEKPDVPTSSHGDD